MLRLHVWQEYHRAAFPELRGFLDYWTHELDGALYSVRVAHHGLIEPSEWRAVGGIIPLS